MVKLYHVNGELVTELPSEGEQSGAELVPLALLAEAEDKWQDAEERILAINAELEKANARIAELEKPVEPEKPVPAPPKK